jgi:hypothetical protein
MDSTLGSVQTDPHHDVAVAPLAAKEHWSGVEGALSRLAHQAARNHPDPQTHTDGDNIVVVPQAAEPAMLVIAPAPQAAERSALVTAADVSAVPPAAAPSVRVTPSDVPTVPQVAGPSVRATPPDVPAGPQVGGPSVLAAVRPAEFRNDPFLGEKPSAIRRTTRAVTRFLIAVCLGIAGSLAWQSYGGAAREMIANRVPQLAWISSRPVINQGPGPAPTLGQAASGPAIEASAPQPAAAQAAPVAQTAPEQTAASLAAPTAPAAPSPDHQQLDAAARDIGALRQSVEQLAARQEQMARDMAKLQAVETSRHRVSAPPPHPAAAAARRPLPPAAPQVSSAVPSPQPPPLMASEPPPHARPPQPAAPPQPAMAPPPLRPPMPVQGQP